MDSIRRDPVLRVVDVMGGGNVLSARVDNSAGGYDATVVDSEEQKEIL
jgi:hypothetical protein